MKPIRGPIDYGGYPPRKRRPAREVQTGDAADDAAFSQQQLSQQEDETDETQDERAARLHKRAQQFRQAAHDVHGFETRAHVVSPHHDEEVVPQDAAENPSSVIASNEASGNAAEQKAQAGREQLQKERAQQERLQRERLQRKAEIQAARRDRNSIGWKRVRRLTWVAAAIVSVQVVGLALTQPEMNVRRVVVEGAHLTPPEVIEQAQTQLAGQNWLRAPTGETANLLQSLPAVQDARIVRRLAWPPQLTIAITERQPFVRVGNDRAWWVADKNGVPFRPARAEDSNLDAIYDATWTPSAGKPLDKEEWTRARQFAALLAQERATGHIWKLRRVYFDTHGFVSLRLAGGFHNETLVQLGGEEWPQKLERARQSLAYLQETGRRAGVLNLITYAMPVWTPRSPVASTLQAGTTIDKLSAG